MHNLLKNYVVFRNIVDYWKTYYVFKICKRFSTTTEYNRFLKDFIGLPVKDINDALTYRNRTEDEEVYRLDIRINLKHSH